MDGYNDFAYYYDVLTENVGYESRCDYIYNLLAENGAGKGILLDLACGTGTLSRLLSQKGYEVIGVDASADMLSVAQEKCAADGADILFLCQRMQELDLFGTIDAAVCTLDSINHVLSEAEVQEIFRRVSLFMNDKGVFVFDVNTPYKHRQVLADNTFVYDTENVFCVWQNSFRKEEYITDVYLDIFEKDEETDAYYRCCEEFSERAYAMEDIRRWLEAVRFEVVGIYEEMTKNPITDTTQRAVFVCKKHGTQLGNC